MAGIHMLKQATIDKIAAGEVVERPASVVKELVENAIDAGATAITVEIKNGGISLIRITDNGEGIKKEEIPLAFLRHSTSKIRSVEDLMYVSSLGFRGEALSSIAAVAQVELITKTKEELSGSRYVIEGAKEIKLEEIGAPNGTTFLVKNLFFNTPARQKFLKTPQTEAGYIADFIEKLALSRPDIAFCFIANNQTKLSTSGSGDLQEVIYKIYGRDVAKNLIYLKKETEHLSVEGYLGKPMTARGNRNYETYFINQRYIKSKLIAKAIEDGYKLHLMQYQYPFTVLNLQIDSTKLDVNVHPTKMELRFSEEQQVFEELRSIIDEALNQKEYIPEITLRESKPEPKKQELPVPEPFETKRIQEIKETAPQQIEMFVNRDTREIVLKEDSIYEQEPTLSPKTEEPKFLEQRARVKQKVIGQVFDTYWLIEYEDKLFIIDQHAAHEKVLFEQMMEEYKQKEFTSQQISPPIIVSLNLKEEELLLRYQEQFTALGYEIEPFGGKEYAISAIPGNLYHLNKQDFFMQMIDELSEENYGKSDTAIIEKIASMSCKAAVKGNHRMSFAEMEALMERLMACENPYQCPHGRPTMISMSQYELEKKFKRVVS